MSATGLTTRVNSMAISHARKSGGLFAQRPHPVGRRQAKGLPKMGDRDFPKIREGQQCLVRHFTHFPDGLQAGCEQHFLYARWELDFTDRRVVRKLWRRLKFAHLPFAFGKSTRSSRNSVGPFVSRRRRWA